MKQKYLLGMLLGGAMLTACSVEDDLNLAPVAEGTEASAPVFNVSFMDEDGLTRATYGNNKVLFEENKDLFSLYHGASANTFAGGYQNAIYEGTFVETEQGSSQMVLSTRSYVMPDYAIMIYPADVTYAWATQADNNGAPVVRVDKDQDETTKLKTPYFSEVLKIKKFNDVEDEKNEQAGYGRKYDVNLRRAAGVLNLTLKESGKITDPDMPEMKINRVEFVTVGDDNKFTTEIAVKAGGKAVSNKDYPLWENAADLDPATAKGENTISTSDIDEETNVAIFTLLPVSEKFTIAGGKVVVHTNYGAVTIEVDEDEDPAKAEEKDKIWSPTSTPTKKMTTTEAVDGFMQAIWGKSTGTLYKDENVGKMVNMTLNVDLSDVKMENMHIKKSSELIEALKVYDYLNKKSGKIEEVTFFLDGTDGEFELTEEAWDELEKRFADKNNKVKVAACNLPEHGACNIVKLTKTSEKANVPEISLVRGGDLNNNQCVDLKLEGKGWSLTSNGWNYSSVRTLIVPETSDLTLQGSIVGDTVKVDNTMSSKDFEIVNYGDVTVSGTVRLESNLTNYGTITIDAGNRLRMAGTGIKLINREAQDTEDEAADGFSTETSGVINNSGDLVIVQNSEAEIWNYGILNINSNGAVTLITANADKNADIAKPFSNKDKAENRMGTIWLKTASAGVGTLTIKEAATSPSKTAFKQYQGFVKYEGTGEHSCAYANYIVINEPQKWTSKQVAYVDLRNYEGTPNDIKISGKGTENGCVVAIIPKGANIFVPSTAKLGTIKYAHFNGFITYAGDLDIENYESYFGKTSAEGRIDTFDGTEPTAPEE